MHEDNPRRTETGSPCSRSYAAILNHLNLLENFKPKKLMLMYCLVWGLLPLVLCVLSSFHSCFYWGCIWPGSLGCLDWSYWQGLHPDCGVSYSKTCWLCFFCYCCCSCCFFLLLLPLLSLLPLKLVSVVAAVFLKCCLLLPLLLLLFLWLLLLLYFTVTVAIATVADFVKLLHCCLTCSYFSCCWRW